jgi:hypothetical protein
MSKEIEKWLLAYEKILREDFKNQEGESKTEKDFIDYLIKRMYYEGISARILTKS